MEDFVKEKEYLYKYRSLRNFARFVDILLYNRLHGFTYTQLDDAMKGRFHEPVGYIAEDTFGKRELLFMFFIEYSYIVSNVGSLCR